MFIHTQWYNPRQTRHEARGLWWLVMAPGFGLICAAIALVIWPALLAYFIASLFLCGGTALIMVGWRMRQHEQHERQHMHRAQTLDLSHRDDYRP